MANSTTPISHIAALSLRPERKTDKNSIESPSTGLSSAPQYPYMSHRIDCVPSYDSPTMDITTEKDTFHFPTPTRRPGTANSSSRFGSFKVSSADSAIGMSTTSLVQSPPFASPLTSQYARTPGSLERMPQPIRANTTREFRSDELDNDRPKLSRWRSLGGIFRKKSRVAASAPPTEPGTKREAVSNLAAASETNLRPKTSQEQQSFSVFRKASKRGARAQITGRKHLADAFPPFHTSASVAPHLDIHIPQAQMERYSVLFNKLPSHPDRQDSLLARRQDTTASDSAQLSSPMKITIPVSGRPRRGTEPSPSDLVDPYAPTFAELASSSTDNFAHISSLAFRPQPLQRNKTAPSMLLVPVTKNHQLSPTLETIEVSSDGIETASTSSSTTSPSTPTWKDSDISASNQRKISWDKISNPELTSTGLSSITISQTKLPTDIPHESSTNMINMPRIVDDESDWVDDKSQCAIARSLSVTKAGSRAGLKPTRVNSKKRTGPRERLKASRTAVPPAVPEKDAASHVTSEARSDSAVSRPPFTRTTSRKDELQRDLTREIWGQHGAFVTKNQLQEKKTLMPSFCVVDDIDARKSVYAVMDTV